MEPMFPWQWCRWCEKRTVSAPLPCYRSLMSRSPARCLAKTADAERPLCRYTFDDVIGNSDTITETINILRKMAATESPVLLIGETGTGKELMAHAVHQASGRAAGPFIAINVAAMPENLLESELFGYEEGAFTEPKKAAVPVFLNLPTTELYF